MIWYVSTVVWLGSQNGANIITEMNLNSNLTGV